MKKILHIIASADAASGGPIEGIMRQYDATKHKAYRELVTLDKPDATYVINSPIKVNALGEQRAERGILGHYGYAPKLITWLRNNLSRFDLVVVNGIWNYSTFAASRVLPASGTPYFVFTHGMLDPWFRKRYPLKHVAKQFFWAFCEGYLLSHSNAVLFTTKEEEQLAKGQFFGWKYSSEVVNYGTRTPPNIESLSTDEFFSKVPELGTRPYFLFLSRIHEKKGCDVLIDAFASFAKENDTYQLVIAGPDSSGLTHELQVRAAAAGIADRLHWAGMLQGDAKWAAYYGANAFVLPSHQENFGIVVAEAMGCGKPVLISNKVNIWREVAEAGAGLVDDDTPAGARRLLTTFSNLSGEQRLEMSRKAKALFLERFDIEKNANMTLDWMLAHG